MGASCMQSVRQSAAVQYPVPILSGPPFAIDQGSIGKLRSQVVRAENRARGRFGAGVGGRRQGIHPLRLPAPEAEASPPVSPS